MSVMSDVSKNVSCSTSSVGGSTNCAGLQFDTVPVYMHMQPWLMSPLLNCFSNRLILSAVLWHVVKILSAMKKNSRVQRTEKRNFFHSFPSNFMQSDSTDRQCYP